MADKAIELGPTADGVAIEGVAVEQSDGTYSPREAIGAVTAGALVKGGSVSEEIECTLADTDYPAAGAVPAGARYVEAYCESACLVALGEATVTATLGRVVPAGLPMLFPVPQTSVAADKTVHVQSAMAGAVVRLSYVP